MRIVLSPGTPPVLEKAADFKRFSIALHPALSGQAAQAVVSVGSMDNSGHVWVDPGAVRDLAADAAKPDWEAGFQAMIGFAARHGWVDGSGRIRAHVEMLDTPGGVDATAFKQAMRRFASGVCIVAAGDGETRCGITVSAFSSVSAEPPMVLVCLNRQAGAHACLTAAKTYSINILRADQTEEAMIFAGQRGLHGAARFGTGWTQGAQGTPVLTEALHSLVCTPVARHEAGTHTVLIGQVVATVAGNEGDALVNFEGALGAVGKAA